MKPSLMYIAPVIGAADELSGQAGHAFVTLKL
jgi:hypothetical protein